MITDKITFVLGNYNNGYAIEMCVKSFMKYNKQYVHKIIICDDGSTDRSNQFYEDNPYAAITHIIRTQYPPNTHYDVKHAEGLVRALELCATEYAFNTHLDVEFRMDVCAELFKVKDQKPLLMGIGGGVPDETQIRKSDMTCCAKYSEWLLFINIEGWNRYKHVGFNQAQHNGISYDFFAWFYKTVYDAGEKLITIPVGHYDDNQYLKHYVAGSSHRAHLIEDIAKEWIKNNG